MGWRVSGGYNSGAESHDPACAIKRIVQVGRVPAQRDLGFAALQGAGQAAVVRTAHLVTVDVERSLLARVGSAVGDRGLAGLARKRENREALPLGGT